MTGAKKEVAKNYAEVQAQKSIKTLEDSFTVFSRKQRKRKLTKLRVIHDEQAEGTTG